MKKGILLMCTAWILACLSIGTWGIDAKAAEIPQDASLGDLEKCDWLTDNAKQTVMGVCDI